MTVVFVLCDVAAAEVEGELHGEVGDGDDAEPEDEHEGLQDTPGPGEQSWLGVLTKVVFQFGPGLRPPPPLLALSHLLLPPESLLHQVQVVLLRLVAISSSYYHTAYTLSFILSFYQELIIQIIWDLGTVYLRDL